MPAADWHLRYQEQAQWTKPLRRHLLNKLPALTNWSVLEFGCGTGVILQDFTTLSEMVVGLDRDLDALSFQGASKALLVNAEAENPPFQDKAFDLVFCHYFLLWLEDPVTVIKAVKRLLKPGGYLAVFAEPDYASRQISAETINKLAELQNRSLAAQGVYLKTGRQLGKLLTDCGFALVELGIIKEASGLSQLLTESEKNVLHVDWEFLHRIREAEITKEEMESILLTPVRWYVPTYYALAVLNN